jgi:hypothetical protein
MTGMEEFCTWRRYGLECWGYQHRLPPSAQRSSQFLSRKPITGERKINPDPLIALRRRRRYWLSRAAASIFRRVYVAPMLHGIPDKR